VLPLLVAAGAIALAVVLGAGEWVSGESAARVSARAEGSGRPDAQIVGRIAPEWRREPVPAGAPDRVHLRREWAPGGLPGLRVRLDARSPVP